MLLQISFNELGIVDTNPQRRALSMLLYASRYLTKNFLIDLSLPDINQWSLTAMELNLKRNEINTVNFLINGIVHFCNMNSRTQIKLTHLGQTFLLLEIFSEYQLPVGSQRSIQ